MKVRVLFLITQSEFGGAQKYVYYLASRLPRDRYEVSVACGPGGLLVPELRKVGIEVIPTPSLVREINLPLDFLAFLELFRLIRRRRPNIVHSNSTKAGLLGRVAAKLAGVPVIIFTAHGFVLNEPMSFWKRILFHFVEFIGGKLSNLVIAVSEADRQLAIRDGTIRHDKIITIHNGINLPCSAVAQKSKADLGLPEDQRIVGTVANFYPTKGLPFFIRAIPHVQRAFPETNFVIVGDGQLRPALERLTANLNLNSRVFFLGKRDDVPEILPLFDVFVLSSVKEGLPFALLEALSAARPVVATTVGGVPEVVIDGQTGLLVPAGDPEALGRAIIALLQNPGQAQAMGEAGRKRVLERFSVERMVTETEQAYRSLLA